MAWGAHVRAQGPWGGEQSGSAAPRLRCPTLPELRAPNLGPRARSPEPEAAGGRHKGARGARAELRGRACAAPGACGGDLAPRGSSGWPQARSGAVFPRGMEIWGVLKVVPVEAAQAVAALRGKAADGFWGGGEESCGADPGGGRRSWRRDRLPMAPAAKLLPPARRLRRRGLIPRACKNKWGKASRWSVDEKKGCAAAPPQPSARRARDHRNPVGLSSVRTGEVSPLLPEPGLCVSEQAAEACGGRWRGKVRGPVALAKPDRQHPGRRQRPSTR